MLTFWFYNKSSQLWVICPALRFALFTKSPLLSASNEKETLKEPAANRFAAIVGSLLAHLMWIAFPSFHLLTCVIAQPCLLKFIFLHLCLLGSPKLYIRDKMKSKTIKSEDYLADFA